MLRRPYCRLSRDRIELLRCFCVSLLSLNLNLCLICETVHKNQSNVGLRAGGLQVSHPCTTVALRDAQVESVRSLVVLGVKQYLIVNASNYIEAHEANVSKGTSLFLFSRSFDVCRRNRSGPVPTVSRCVVGENWWRYLQTTGTCQNAFVLLSFSQFNIYKCFPWKGNNISSITGVDSWRVPNILQTEVDRHGGFIRTKFERAFLGDSGGHPRSIADYQGLSGCLRSTLGCVSRLIISFPLQAGIDCVENARQANDSRCYSGDCIGVRRVSYPGENHSPNFKWIWLCTTVGGAVVPIHDLALIMVGFLLRIIYLPHKMHRGDNCLSGELCGFNDRIGSWLFCLRPASRSGGDSLFSRALRLKTGRGKRGLI